MGGREDFNLSQVLISFIISSLGLFNFLRMISRYPPGTRDRWNRIVEGVNLTLRSDIPKFSHFCFLESLSFDFRTKEECIWQFKNSNTSSSSSSNQTVSVQISSSPSTTTSSSEEKKEDWSRSQQSQLESALKAFPASNFSSSKERWKEISKVVDGKSLKQCVARYKKIREELMKK